MAILLQTPRAVSLPLAPVEVSAAWVIVGGIPAHGPGYHILVGLPMALLLISGLFLVATSVLPGADSNGSQQF